MIEAKEPVVGAGWLGSNMRTGEAIGSTTGGLSIDEIMAAMRSMTAVELAELIRRLEKEFGASVLPH